MKPRPRMLTYILPAIIAIVGSISYHYLLKQVSPSINPIVSILALYAGLLLFSPLLFLIFPIEGGLMSHIRQINWIQAGLALAVLCIEVGFLMMYRGGWEISTGNIVTGVATNLALIAIGLLLFSERITWTQALGVVLSMAGVVLIQLKPAG